MSNVTKISSKSQFDNILGQNKHRLVVVLFWADWHQASKQQCQVVEALAKERKDSHFIMVEAEEYEEVTEQYEAVVSSVPTVLFLVNGDVKEVMTGANPAKLVQLVDKNAKRIQASSRASTDTKDSGSSEDKLNARLKKLINAFPVMIFIKGSPDQPRCGFSSTLIQLLRKQNVDFRHFDILQDNEVRQGLKAYSNWPTFPQLYANGELIGGLDVITELIQDGEFLDIIPDACNPNAGNSGSDDLNSRLKKLISSNRIVLFMKGDRNTPRCGFSAKAINLLKEAGCTDPKSYDTFDIFSDNDVREGLKVYSNWPTYPQLYVDSELVGGLDVMSEMHEDGDLADLLAPSDN